MHRIVMILFISKWRLLDGGGTRDNLFFVRNNSRKIYLQDIFNHINLTSVSSVVMAACLALLYVMFNFLIISPAFFVAPSFFSLFCFVFYENRTRNNLNKIEIW